MTVDAAIITETKKILQGFGETYLTKDGALKRTKLIEDLDKYTPILMKELLSSEMIRKSYTEKINDTTIFKLNQFIEMFTYKEYWEDSYTKYSNKIGLTAGGKFIDETADVVLDFPFKDTVLKAGMTKEDARDSNEPFLNEVIAKAEIDTLLEPKIFVNAKKYDAENPDGKPVSEISDSDNLIIKGNNLIALHSIKARYAGKVKLIYIDPPYNTGNDSFGYNDRFNHSAWLTFMKNRLEVARELLSEDGVIIVNSDEVEQAYLKLLLDMIFGRENFVGDLIWQKRKGGGNDSRFIALDHDYLAVYAKNIQISSSSNKWRIGYEEEYLTRYKFLDEKTGLRYYWDTLARNGLKNPIPVTLETPDGTEIFLNSQSSKATILAELENGNVKFTQGKNGWTLHHKVFQPEGKVLRSILKSEFTDLPTNKNSNDEISALFGKSVFGTPKPEGLLKTIIDLTTNENDLVLDFFMGSATTQAVAMKMRRRFIGIEQMDYINTVSVERLKKVIGGEQGGISKTVSWQGGGSFTYTELFEKNAEYAKIISQATTEVELLSALTEMQSLDGDFDFRIEIDNFKTQLENSDLTFAENQKLALKAIDKNQLYYNFSEIEDKNVSKMLDNGEWEFNMGFYGEGTNA
ncbi:MAG: site-specific DNA-methyltransferase [Streptococcaceae bacterium]|jgi:adenine-specific DNA-methyltransferase|nr:site-specific DNA-methyltransferase [Streptococcaceae bacterium]